MKSAYPQCMSTVMAATAGDSVQPFISLNVRILMATKGIDQRQIGAIIGKTAGGVSHKLSGRAEWSADEIVKLSVYGGPKWPLARFFNDPEAESATLTNPAPYLRPIQGEGRDRVPRTPLATLV